MLTQQEMDEEEATENAETLVFIFFDVMVDLELVSTETDLKISMFDLSRLVKKYAPF